MKNGIFTLGLLLGLQSILYASSVGLGVFLGEPSGIHVRYNHQPKQFLHFTLGGSFVDKGLSIGADYLFQLDVGKVKNTRFYAGPGILMQNTKEKVNKEETSVLQLGPNGRVGGEYFFPKTQFSIYLDIGIHLFLIPDPKIGAGFVIGGTYWPK